MKPGGRYLRVLLGHEFEAAPVFRLCPAPLLNIIAARIPRQKPQTQDRTIHHAMPACRARESASRKMRSPCFRASIGEKTDLVLIISTVVEMLALWQRCYQPGLCRGKLKAEF